MAARLLFGKPYQYRGSDRLLDLNAQIMDDRDERSQPEHISFFSWSDHKIRLHRGHHPDRRECGESDGTSTCVIRPGDHAPASNCTDGPVRHEGADGSAWIGPMGAEEAAMAREAAGL